MERITRRIGESIDFVDGKGYATLPHKEGVKLLFEKLAEYEDIGMTPDEIYKVIKRGVPEWIDKYLEYRKLEEQGLLIKLPCKVGDMVYETNINRNIISIYRITSIVVMSESRNYNWGLISGIYSNMNGFNEFALGKTIFLTREDAEKALEKSVLEKETNYGME